VPRVPDGAVQAAAEVMLRQYESAYSAPRPTWRDFADPAREILEAAAPVLADAVAAKITGHMESFGPPTPLTPADPVGRQHRAWRRHFGIAARVAAGAFSTREDQLREAARAIADGKYVACTREEDGSA
jgi:hypothetical protein